MAGFNFEKNLPHQTQAVSSTVSVFQSVPTTTPAGPDSQLVNPEFDYAGGLAYGANILHIQGQNSIREGVKNQSNIIDIMMETGTGKTYTYAKTIFELNKQYGIFKFIVVVPTLSIKAGTINFLTSDSSREHFKEQYGKTINLHVVESQKGSKNKKAAFPAAVSSFVNAGSFEKDYIQVMVINMHMVTSETMQKPYDTQLFDKHSIPVAALAAVKPFLIVDEPHKFETGNKTWQSILKIRPQFILRYGATFPEKEISRKDPLSGKTVKTKVKDYHNLVYTLNAVDSFNRNLVKGVVGHITEFDSGKNVLVTFISSDGKEARFELNENGKKKTIPVPKKESLEKIHPAMSGLLLENLNKSTAELSNGMALKKGDKLNPYAYAQTLQESMLEKAIKHHFELEKQLLTRDVKIKPLTLFFIDNIEEYRSPEGYVRKTVEKLAEAEIKALIEAEKPGFYKSYLERTLTDLSKMHGGYFSKDNSDKDEAIEKEINEILHDKQAMLDLDNPRRFIFSKWTLREGWDNPNVFQICKLRSSGSETSKLQEVGRGLRLPVNEFGNRVKDEQFYLNYFVDFTETDFVDKLVNEINSKSGAISMEQVPEKLTNEMISKICELYETTEDDLLTLLDGKNLITRTNSFKEGGFDFIKHHYTRIFEGVNSNKVRKATDVKKKVSVRTEKYQELKELWEKLNEKVILEYKFENEASFLQLFTNFLHDQKHKLSVEGFRDYTSTFAIKNGIAEVKEAESVYGRNRTSVATLSYSAFLKELSKVLHINLKTLHQAIVNSAIDINPYLSATTIRVIKQNFDYYLMANAIDKYSIAYKKVSNAVHPTKLTDSRGNVLKEITASDVGVLFSDEKVADSYLLEDLYFDSELEKMNIQSQLTEVVVFTKIPKNSIKIPVAGGKSYSPDFAYVLNFKDGSKQLHMIVESKNVGSEEELRNEEKYKIKFAEKFFDGKVKIRFKKQLGNQTIADLVKQAI